MGIGSGDQRALDQQSYMQEQQAVTELRRSRREAQSRFHASYSDEPGRRHVHPLPWVAFVLLLLVLVTNVGYARGPLVVTVVTCLLLAATAMWGVLSYLRPGTWP